MTNFTAIDEFLAEVGGSSAPDSPALDKKAKQDAFYAAAGSPDSDKEKTYNRILEEMKQQGYSDYVESVKQRWIEEQKNYATTYTKEKILDSNVPFVEKKATVDAYRSGEMVDPNLRTQFAENASEKDLGKSSADTQSQLKRQNDSLTVNVVQEKIAPGSKKDIERADHQKTFLQKLKEAGGAFVDGGAWALEHPKEAVSGLWDVGHTLVSGLAHTTAGGFAGMFMVAIQDAEKANELMTQINSSIYRGDGKGYEKGMEALAKLGEAIDVPFKALADKTYDVTGSPALGAVVYAVPQAFGYVAGGYVGVKAALKGASAAQSVKAAVKAANPFAGLDKDKVDFDLGPSGEAYYKKKLKEATGVRTEPVIHDINLIDPDTPASVVGQANPIAATHIGTSAVLDSTGKLADSMGTTRAELLNTWLLPKLDPELSAAYPDIYNNLVRKDLEAKALYQDAEIDNYLFDSSRIDKSIDRYFSVLKEHTELTMNLANSTIERAGDTIRGKVKFTRNEGYGWTDPHEALRMANKLNKSLREQRLWSRKRGDPELGNGYQWSEVKIDFNDRTQEYTLNWDFNRKFDSEQDLFFGQDVVKADFGPWDVSGLANTVVGKWLFNPAVRLPKWVTQGMSRADIRATSFEKLFATTLRDNILKHSVGKEISSLIHKGEEANKYFSVSDIKEMFPHIGETKVKSIVEGYNHYRRLADYSYQITNRSVRSHYIKSGQHGLYNGDEYLGVGRPVYDTEFEKVGTPKVLWDFHSQTAIPAGESINRPGWTIAKLYKPIHKEGKSYDYAWVEKANGPLPKQVVPNIAGYFPHINKEPYFISLHPKEVEANGLPVTDSRELARYVETIGVARTEKEAIAFAEKLQKEHPDAIVWARPDRYDDINDTITNLDIAKFNLDVTKSRKQDRLRTPDGSVGRIEDPAIALYQRMQQIIRLDAWKDIDFEFRKNFIDSYKEFLTDGKFPSDEYPLLRPINPSKEISKAYNSAITLLEHYKTQQHMATTTEKWHKAGVIGIAKKLEGTPAIAEYVRGISKGSGITGAATKLATIKFMHLNPLRQWLIQPAQVTELVPMAMATGNSAFIKEASALAHPMFKAILGEAPILPNWIKAFMKKDGNSGTGMNEKEFAEIMEAFKRTGIPTGIDLNSVLHGVFREAGRGLDESWAERFAQGTKKTIMFIPNTGKTLGFTGAEMLNNIFLFLYAKTDFQTRFPDKKWNDPHNLEMIAAKALSTGNTMMGRGDQLPYQHGMLRAVMQFMSYTHKATLQPFMNKSLTKEEKIAMFVARGVLFGKRGISGVTGMERILNATLPQDAVLPAELSQDGKEGTREEVLRILSTGLVNEITNKFFNTFFDQGPAKTQLDIAKSISPIGDTGIPFGDYLQGIWDFMQGDKDFYRTMPFLSMASSFTDTVNELHSIWSVRKLEEMTPMEAFKSISILGEWASGMNNYEKALTMKQIEDYETKTGQKLGFNLTATEITAKAFGISSAKEQVLFDIGKLEKHRLEYLDDSAKKIIKDLNAVEDFYGENQGNSTEDFKQFAKDRYNRIGFLVNLYDQGGMKEELLEKVWEQDARRQEEGLPSVIGRIMDRKQYEIDKYRQQEIRILDKIRKSDPAAAEALEMMFYDVKNFDKEETK